MLLNTHIITKRGWKFSPYFYSSQYFSLQHSPTFGGKKESVGNSILLKTSHGSSVLDVAKSISEGLARVAVCGKINDELVDLNYRIEEDCALEIITNKSEEYKEVLKLLKAGYPIRKVAKLTEVSESTVKRLKREFCI